MSAVAELTGLTYATIHGYHNRASQRRRAGATRPGDMPPPDDKFGSSPVWHETTIHAWLDNRPGRGVGGGRPRKHHHNTEDGGT